MTNARLALIFLTGIILSYYSVADWHPADANMLTKWSQYINPEKVHNAYPRPQLKRNRWKNLNGAWQFEFVSDLKSPPVGQDLNRRILIPFPIESNLSGIMESQTNMWYRRTFDLPADWQRSRVLLHFDRIMGKAVVYLNGQKCANFDNCETRLTSEITSRLQNGKNELLVGIEADRCSYSGSISDAFSSHGIALTVWLEPVPRSYLSNINYISNFTEQNLILQVDAIAMSPSLSVQASIFDGDTQIARAQAALGKNLYFNLKNLKRWSPEQPFLYTVKTNLLENGKAIDSVNGYVGIKDYQVVSEISGGHQPVLNGRKLFQLGIIDHGYWLDGNITAPSDRAICADIQNIKKMGFNLIVNSGCLPSDRWLYWCDKIGLLVWQNIPQNYANFSSAEHERVQSLLEVYQSHASFASLVICDEPQMKTNAQLSPTPVRYCNKKQHWNQMVIQYIQPEIMISHIEEDKYQYSSMGAADGVGKIINSMRDTYPVDFSAAQDMTDAAIEFNTNVYHRKLVLAKKQAQAASISTLVYPQYTDLPGRNFGLQTDDRRQFKVNVKKMRKINKTLEMAGIP